MYPELGAYNFIVNRPYLGRFPMATFSWFRESWHQELLEDLARTRPRIVILDKDPGPSFPEVFFKVEKNKKKYDEVLDFILHNYKLAGETQGLWIYEWDSGN